MKSEKPSIWNVFQNTINSFSKVGWTLFLHVIYCYHFFKIFSNHQVYSFHKVSFEVCKFCSGLKISILFIFFFLFTIQFLKVFSTLDSKTNRGVFFKKGFSFFCSLHPFVYTFIVHNLERWNDILLYSSFKFTYFASYE